MATIIHWIKIRVNLCRDPKVVALANLMAEPLKLSPTLFSDKDDEKSRKLLKRAVIGMLVDVWGAARQFGRRVGEDLFLPHANLQVIDDLADVNGFAAAMQQIGWLRLSLGGVTLPNFFESFNADLNDSVIRKREVDRLRQQRCRARKAGKQIDQTTIFDHATASLEAAFQEFYSLYPRKSDRNEAAEVWHRIQPDESLVRKIMESLRQHLSKHPDWRRENGRYIPKASKWLVDQQWEWKPLNTAKEPESAADIIARQMAEREEAEELSRRFTQTLNGGGK